MLKAPRGGLAKRMPFLQRARSAIKSIVVCAQAARKHVPHGAVNAICSYPECCFLGSQDTTGPDSGGLRGALNKLCLFSSVRRVP